jgi:hypothetical protein
MMTSTHTLYARAGAAAIAAALALSPTYAAAPKPIIDLSKSPALSGDQAPPASTAKPERKIGPFDEQTAEIGGGALAAIILGMGALALSRRKRRREEESWQSDASLEDQPVPEASNELEQSEPMMLSEPVAQEQAVAPPIFHGNEPRRESADADCDELETWTERAKCGPTEDNPSQSLKKRMKRAAFFEKRDREVAAGEAAPVDPDAGLPEAMVDEQEQQQA